MNINIMNAFFFNMIEFHNHYFRIKHYFYNLNNMYKKAVFVGADVDVGKLVILKQIPQWVMMSKFPSIDHLEVLPDNRFQYFFGKLKKAMKLIANLETISQESDPFWVFSNETQKVYYFHSVRFPDHFPYKCVNELRSQLLDVDTVVHSGGQEDQYLLRLCPKIKYYITSGDYGDTNGDSSMIQEAFFQKELRPRIWFVNDTEYTQLLFFYVLFNYPYENFVDELKSNLAKCVLTPYSSLQKLVHTVFHDNNHQEVLRQAVQKYSNMVKHTQPYHLEFED